MGTISSGVGLMSGMDIQGLVEQLMAIEARPRMMLEARVQTLIAERTAFLELNALILAVKNASARFDEGTFFNKAKAVSSDENVITAVADEGALPGSYSLTVHSLVTNHQMISSGFATPDATRVGAGTVTIESAEARLDPQTSLALLNGGAGVQRGAIRITDRSGASTEIDLTTALTVDDVIEAINSQMAVGVTASVSGGRLVLTDHTGQAVGNLSVSNVGLGRTATDLGIAGSVAGDVLTGSSIVTLNDHTDLSLLNDGNGMRRDGSLDDFQIQLRDGSTIDVNLSGKLRSDTRLEALNDGAGVRLGVIRITNRTGGSADVDLTGAVDLADVQAAINGSGLGVTATLINSHLVITDGTGDDESSGALKIEDVTGHAAGDLGIAQEVEASTIVGSDVYDVDSLGDVMRAINLDSENAGNLVAAISGDGLGITLTDSSAGGGATTVVALNGSRAADDLGILTSSTIGTIESRHLMAGLNTVLLQSLNGGSGVALGTIQVAARDGTTTQIDLTGLNSLGELIEAINAVSDASRIAASINRTGNGVVLTDLSGGSGNLVVTDTSGSTAADLNLLVDAAVDSVDSGNLQLRYISETTRLDDLNGGEGVASGRFTITDSSGAAATVDLTQGNEVTLADVIREINSRGIGVVASINETGDGMLLTDTAGGTGQLTVTEEDGTTAADLGILGTASEGETTIDGSFEIRIEIDVDDTLNDVMAKINGAEAGVQPSILSDGSPVHPYRMVLASELGGRRGELIVDGGETDLTFSTLIRARDAVVFLGEPSSPSSLMLISSTNTLDELVPNVKIDLLATSDSPVEINVTRDVEGLVTDMKTFVTTFNAVVDKIEDLTSFNSETFEKGPLFGDATVHRIRDRLYRMLRTTVETGGTYRRFGDVGLTLGSGAKLRLDEDQFRQALAEQREEVEALFAGSQTGLGAIIEEELKAITEPGSGLIDRHNERLGSQEELLNDRIDDLQVLLDAKEQRLYRQWFAMEQALAQLNAMQTAVSALSLVTTQLRQSTGQTSSSLFG